MYTGPCGQQLLVGSAAAEFDQIHTAPAARHPAAPVPGCQTGSRVVIEGGTQVDRAHSWRSQSRRNALDKMQVAERLPVIDGGRRPLRLPPATRGKSAGPSKHIRARRSRRSDTDRCPTREHETAPVRDGAVRWPVSGSVGETEPSTEPAAGPGTRRLAFLPNQPKFFRGARHGPPRDLDQPRVVEQEKRLQRK